MKVLIANEAHQGETRVAATPETVRRFAESGLEVQVESGAGEAAFLGDDDFRDAGAQIVTDRVAARKSANVLLRVGRLGEIEGTPEAALLPRGAVVIGFLDPFFETATVRQLAEGGITSLPMEFVPRVTRAQSMDALSSQASIAGYKAVLLAADRLPRYFPLLMTAAGTVRPAKVVVIGAGVAGLQAIATARRLGALVEVSDIRPAVQEQVESLGARFIDLPDLEGGEGSGGYARQMDDDFLRRQREILAEHVSAADAVITTAAVPGKPAPRLLSADMVHGMKPGGVVVDLAAERGGNCELTRPDEVVVDGGITVLGPVEIARAMPRDASALYARNVAELFDELLVEGDVVVDRENDVIGPCVLTHEGRVVHQAVARHLEETN